MEVQTSCILTTQKEINLSIETRQTSKTTLTINLLPC